jgi:hydrogenase maturation protease
VNPRVLVAGIGNVFLGDDGFGVEVVRRLAQRPLPEGVRVVDFGIRGLDLSYELLDGYDLAILVDAAPRGHAGGTVHVLEPEADEDPRSADLDTHGMHPAKSLALARAMGGRLPRLRVVGCEPVSFGDAIEGTMGLSPPVAAAVDEAVQVVERLVAEARGKAGHA